VCNCCLCVWLTCVTAGAKSSQSMDKDLPSFPYRSGKITLKNSPRTKARSKVPVEPSWLDTDDVFGFDAED